MAQTLAMARHGRDIVIRCAADDGIPDHIIANRLHFDQRIVKKALDRR